MFNYYKILVETADYTIDITIDHKSKETDYWTYIIFVGLIEKIVWLDCNKWFYIAIAFSMVEPKLQPGNN